jgi:glucose/mannose transport system substrate-binding protein
MRTFRSRTINRRQFAAGSAVFATVAVMPGIRVAAQDASPAAEAEDQLEIFSWWTAGSEAAGLEKLFAAFSEVAPDVEIINAAVAGGAGSNAQAALQTRLGGGDPPDSWQSHPGEELWARYIEPGYCQPMTSLWDEEGWNDVIPQGLIDQVTFEDEKYLIPVGVHRGNVAFYNKQVLADNGIEVGDSISVDDFFAAADTLKAAGVSALALGSKDPFAAPHLFENILCGHLGPEAYAGLWTGETPWDGEEVTGAIETFAKMLDYVNEDHPSLTWDGAMDLVMNGTAAFTSMGDWAYGNAVVNGVEDEIGYVAHPGSESAFIAVVDGFTLPVDVPHPNNAMTWLRAVGTAEAQAAFAPDKGCIPARTDVDVATLNEYSQWSANDFGEATVVPSNAHGAAASPQFQQSIFEATVPFLVDRDVAMFQEALVFAAEDAQLGS